MVKNANFYKNPFFGGIGAGEGKNAPLPARKTTPPPPHVPLLDLHTFFYHCDKGFENTLQLCLPEGGVQSGDAFFPFTSAYARVFRTKK